MLIGLFAILLVFIIGDIYFYQAIATLTHTPGLHLGYWAIDISLLTALIGAIFMLRAGINVRRFINVLMAALLLIFVPKIFSSLLLMGEDIVRLFQGFPARSVLVSEITIALAGAIFLVVLFGITGGKHFYRVKRETLYFPDLPAAFDGFTITQLSDVHSGSFTDAKGVQKGLDLASAQNSDLLLFTGDLVNNKASEMDPWIPSFAKLKAPYGIYSILGNHDYGDYHRWESAAEKAANFQRLKEVHAEIGFKLLLNESVTIQKQGQSLSLVGVENWGKGGFHKYGDLKRATANVPDHSFKILMSHDPSHWEEETIDHHQHVHLTLAGHTHGMQFGIELLGFKWSPIKYFYKQWAGLYNKGGKYLYVNRGFGFHGLNGRIGIWPEITVLTLKRGDAALAA